MKVITGPKVTLIGHTIFKEHSTYKIPADGTGIERLGAFAAKGCYDSFGETGRACQENQREIIEHRHGSVLEHSYASLFLEGITRALTLELNRHRLFNISQRSTRYTKEEDSAIVLEPYYADIWNRYRCSLDESGKLVSPQFPYLWDGPNIKYPEGLWSENVPVDYRLLSKFIEQCDAAIGEYADQVEMLVRLNPNKLEGFALRKWARGKARNVLPHALETRGTWTMNFRAWRWFIEARSNRHAEPEIRRLAEHVLVVLKPLAPIYFEDFQLNAIVDNIPEYVPQHSKI